MTIVVSDVLFFQVSPYTPASVAVAGLLCFAVTMSLKAARAWIVAVILALHTGFLFITGELWLPGAYNVGIICGVGWWLWVLATLVIGILSAVRVIRTRMTRRNGSPDSCNSWTST